MAGEISAGAISLDLVIKNKIGEQLERIKRSAEGPASKVGEAIEKAISAPMEKAGKAVGKAVSEAVNEAVEDIDNTLDVATAAWDKYVKSLENANLPDMRDRVRIAEPKADMGGFTEEIVKAAEKLDDTVAETVDKAKEKLSELGDFEVSSDPTSRMRQEIELVTEQLDLLQKKWQELSSADPTDKVISQLNATEQRIISTQNKLDSLKNKLNELEKVNPEVIPSEAVTKAEEVASKIKASFKNIGKEILSFTIAPLRGIKNTITEPFIAAANTIKSTYAKIKNYLEHPLQAVKDLGSKAFTSLKNTGNRALKSLRSHFGSVGKSATSLIKPVSKLGTALKNTFKRVFLMAGIYAAFRAIKDGVLEAAKADEQFADSLNSVKANLAIAFQPILQAIMPALNTLMAGLAAVTKQVAGFIAGLFGSTYKQAAEATKKLKSTADVAKKAKMSMAGIDEMNVLSGGDDNNSEDKDGVDYSKIDMSEPELPDWAEKLKESIKSGDWKGVGAILAERVNSAFSAIKWDSISAKLNNGIGKVTDAINGFLDRFTAIGGWETLGDTVAGGLNTVTSAVNKFYDSIDWSTLGSGIAKGLNRAINKTDWDQLGKALSAKIKAFIDAAFAFVTTFDFKGFGEGIGTAVNGWFNNIDFKKAGKTLSEGIKGIFDTAIKFIQTVDWKNIGKKIADFIGNIDWGGIASRVFELLGSALAGAVSLLWGAISGVVTKIKDYFKGKIEDAGGNIILGLLKGIGDGLLSIGKWIKDHIFKPFWNGIKKVFGIASPSKKMGEIGGFIIQGLLNAISNGIKAVGEIFKKLLAAIIEVFVNIHEWFREKFQEAWDNIAAVWSVAKKFFSDIWEGIKAVFSAIGNWFKEKFENALNIIIAIWTTVHDFFQGIWDGIKSIFSAVGDWFKEKFSTALNLIITVWTAVHDFFEGIWTGIKNIFSSVGKWFKDKFKEAFDNVVAIWTIAHEFFTKVWEGIKSIFSKVGTWFKDKFKEAWDNVKAIWSLAKAFFQKVWDGIKEVFAKVGNWFKEKFQEAIDNIKAVWSIITNFFSGLWDGIKGVFSSVGTWFKDKFNEALNNIKAVFSGISDFFSGIWDKIKNIFSDIGSKIGESFSNAFKSVVNSVFEFIEGRINNFIDEINTVIDLINEIPGVDLGFLDYVELPRLAKGGLATAPTLAMVGDNRNASVDPEVISPLSKLKGMGIGGDPEVVELLRMILELLKNGINIEIINYLFRNSKEFSREVLNVVNLDKARSGK